jgi:hypothetical protein
LTAKLVKLQQIKNQMDWLNSTYKFYGGYSDVDLENNKGIVKNDIGKIHEQMKKYDEDPTRTFTPPELPALDKGTPALQYIWGVSPAWGGTGGYHFENVDVNSYIQKHTRLIDLKLRAGRYIDRISATYQNDDHAWLVDNGGSGGSETNKLQLLEGQFVTKVEGRSGDLVDYLTIATTGSHSISGGGEGGGWFSWSVPDGSFVLGFLGRSGDLLHRIQVVYAHFLNAKWIPVEDK